jgi:uncharacterized protein YaeQ
VVKLWAFSSAVPVWWQGIENKLTRLTNLEVWQVPTDQSKELALLAERSMQLQVTVQEGQIWVGNKDRSVAVEPKPLMTQRPKR